MSSHTFLWHDYETFGVNARSTRPAQFAAVRTDAELNPVGEPVMLYCRPAPDFLPEPEACLITGITPLHCLAHGLPEYRFARAVFDQFAEPGTIGVGYNSIRYDDEVTRHLFWRSLIDPYVREWKNGCARWDLLDVARAAYALRPGEIVWPLDDDGRASFKLEKLARANGLAHEAAHDALSDVQATIALARLIRRQQPRLFDFCLNLRNKAAVAREMGWPHTPRPFLHVSGMFGVERGCLAVMWPLAAHPGNRNEILCWDLGRDPKELEGLDAATIRRRLFTPAAELPPDEPRLPLKSVHLNRAPIVVASLKTLTESRAQQLGIDLDAALRHAEIAARLPERSNVDWLSVLAREKETAFDVDQDLYGGFVGDADRRRLDDYAHEVPAAERIPAFDAPRLAELVWRYRARNFPEQLTDVELARWAQHCASRLVDGAGGALTLAEFDERLMRLDATATEAQTAILADLADYADTISTF